MSNRNNPRFGQKVEWLEVIHHAPLFGKVASRARGQHRGTLRAEAAEDLSRS